MKFPLLAGSLAAGLLLATTGFVQAQDHSAHAGMAMSNPLLDAVRKANDRFKDVKVAKAEGYEPIACASSATAGAMGIHYVNGTLLKDDALDIAKPEAVMYEPKPDGSLELVAVEYITLKGPASLGGQLFNFTDAPNRYGLPGFYELHAWAWRQNPAGAFADNNPRVSCDAAKP